MSVTPMWFALSTVPPRLYRTGVIPFYRNDNKMVETITSPVFSVPVHRSLGGPAEVLNSLVHIPCGFPYL